MADCGVTTVEDKWYRQEAPLTQSNQEPRDALC